MFGRLTRRLAALTAMLGAGVPVAMAVTVPVSTPAGLRNAIAAANPGDVIVLADGTYAITGNLNVNRAGTIAQPIVVRAATPQAALIRFDAVEGFKVSVSDWRFEGLVIEGVCALDDDCEHAFHLLSGADRTVLRNNWVRDFNAQVKGNGEPLGAGGTYLFADDVLIEGNRFYDTRPRDTGNPVTKLDIVGGRRWIVRGNYIYDYEKLGGDTVSYAAFLKGNSRDGVFERNWVMCTRAFSGGVRIGLSLGGGGTGAQFCEDGTCVTEHQNGRLRNNLIANCDDVGIYLNRAQNTLIDHNTLYNTAGIDVRFATSTATIRNNALTGAIRNRDGGTSTPSGNVVNVPVATLQGWFVDPAQGDFRALNVLSLVNQGVAGTGVVDDFCGDDRNDGLNDIGAIEYDGENDCDTRLGAPTGAIFADSFE